jgi:hypothetical protein
MPWLEAEYPELLDKYRAWYQRDAYLQPAYVEILNARVERIRLRHGLTERGNARRPPDWLGPAQLKLFAC